MLSRAFLHGQTVQDAVHFQQINCDIITIET